LRQVVELQDITFQAAEGLIADFQATSEKEERARVASAISNLAKGWVSLQDAKREILGKPKAGVRKHAVEKPKLKVPPWPETCGFSEELPPGCVEVPPPEMTLAPDALAPGERKTEPERISLVPRGEDGEPLPEED
jgi:hypothetical protein